MVEDFESLGEMERERGRCQIQGREKALPLVYVRFTSRKPSVCINRFSLLYGLIDMTVTVLLFNDNCDIVKSGHVLQAHRLETHITSIDDSTST